MIVVIPSNRSVNLSYLGPLIDSGARFIIVDDSEGTITINHPRFKVYNWNDRRRILGPSDEHFPRRNGVCRDFGFHIAWRESDPGEAIVALDDDCRVYREDFAEEVERSLSDALRPVATAAGEHLNILDLYNETEPAMFPRGFPYSARVGYCPATIEAAESHPVMFSLGMWKGIYDINAVDKIRRPQYINPNATLRHPSVIVAASKLVSVCAMNMQFRREVIPAAYQFPMHLELINGGVIDRYGDIWGGFVLKTLMDLNGHAFAVGEPMIEHFKEGDYLRNIWQENLGHQINDEFLRMLAETSEEISPGPYLDMVEGMTEVFRAREDRCSPLLRQYLRYLVPALRAWTASLR